MIKYYIMTIKISTISSQTILMSQSYSRIVMVYGRTNALGGSIVFHDVPLIFHSHKQLTTLIKMGEGLPDFD